MKYKAWWFAGLTWGAGLVSTAVCDETVCVSMDPAGNGANGATEQVRVSANGRYVAFTSWASNLVAGDGNGVGDVFVHDLVTGTTVRASVDSSGVQGNGESRDPALSGDGRLVAFKSAASNLIAADGNGVADIFLRDLLAGTTTRISVSTSGDEANAFSDTPDIAADGSVVCFHSLAANLVAGDTNNLGDVFVRDLGTGETTRASVDSSGAQGNGESDVPKISENGRGVLFRSAASNLVPGDSNGQRDVFLHLRLGSTTERISLSSSGEQGNATSSTGGVTADLRYVVFESRASNLVASDGNGNYDVFLRDRWQHTTERVSVDSMGGEALGLSARPRITPDARYVAYWSNAANLVAGDVNAAFDALVLDRQTSLVTRASVSSAGVGGNADSDAPTLSDDGKVVAFASAAGDLVAGDGNGVKDAFARRDLTAREFHRVSVSSAEDESDGTSGRATLSACGRFVAFRSEASNLVPGDSNAIEDVFVRDRELGTTVRANLHSSGAQANGPSPPFSTPSVSPEGRYVVFDSDATNLVDDDSNGETDVFVHDLATGVTQRLSVSSSGEQADTESWDSWASWGARYVVFRSRSEVLSGYPLAGEQVFVHEKYSATTRHVSVSSSGVPANDACDRHPFITEEGEYVAFTTPADNLVPGDINLVSDVFVREIGAGITERVSISSAGVQGNAESYYPSMTDEGFLVAFLSAADNLVAGDTNGAWDVFVHDRRDGTTRRVSVDSRGHQVADGAHPSHRPRIARDGRHVVFVSDSPDLVPGDTNGRADVFVHDLEMGTTTCATERSGVWADGDSGRPDLSARGHVISFDSAATNLVAGDLGGLVDCFVHVRCEIYLQTFGQGLAGSGGIVPQLDGGSGASATEYSIEISETLGSMPAILWAGSGRTDQFPVFGGHFYVGPILFMKPLVLFGPPIPGEGWYPLSGYDLSAYPWLDLYLQAMIFDPGAPRGVSMTPGLLLSIED